MTIKKKLHEDNRLSWNAATRAHNSHKGDQAAFLRGGGSTLFPEELGLLGDLKGRTLLHMMCNSGQDTLSLASLGASVTGVDISDEAIDAARALSRDSGLPGQFFRSDVYDWLDNPPHGPFDLAFCSYGAIYWLSDIKGWADRVARVLSPYGGKLVIVEFHPTLWLFNEQWALTWPYTTGGEPLTEEEGVGDYVARSGQGLVPWGYEAGVEGFQNPHRAHGFAWGLGDIVGAILGAGLTLEALVEYPYSNGTAIFDDMRRDADNRCWPPERIPTLPVMFGLAASRP